MMVLLMLAQTVAFATGSENSVTMVLEENQVATGELVDSEFMDIGGAFAFAEKAINGLVTRGIIDGMGNNLYEPEGLLTRAQISKIMVLSLGHEPVDYTGDFTDVSADDWFAPYIQAAIEAGIFKGYDDGTFKPNQIINRQELATVVGRGAVEANIVTAERMARFVMEKSDFEDKELVPDWAAHEVAWLEAQGVFEAIATEYFEPTSSVNRAEAAVVVYNTLLFETEDPTVELLITGSGVYSEVRISTDDWQKYEMVDRLYSALNSLKFHKIVKTRGYDLFDLIGYQNLRTDQNYDVTFTCADGYMFVKSVDSLKNTYFTEGTKEEVRPILARYVAVISDYPEANYDPPITWEDRELTEDDLDPDFPKLIFGQAYEGEINMPGWGKEIIRITIGDEIN